MNVEDPTHVARHIIDFVITRSSGAFFWTI